MRMQETYLWTQTLALFAGFIWNVPLGIMFFPTAVFIVFSIVNRIQGHYAHKKFMNNMITLMEARANGKRRVR